MNRNQSGFGVLGLVLILVALSAIGLASWRVFGDTEGKPKRTNPDNIIKFIELQNLPKVKTSETRVDDLASNVQLFTVQYGEPQDCPSGCFYSSASGITSNGKIGWVSISDSDKTVDSKNIPYYDFDSSDNHMFSNEFSEQLLARNEPAHNGFIQLLARDKDTPLNTLASIATKLSSQTPDSCLVRSLAKNDILKADNESYKKIQNLYKENLTDDYVVKHLYNNGYCEKI